MKPDNEKDYKALNQVLKNASSAVRSPGFYNRMKADVEGEDETKWETNPEDVSERDHLVPADGKYWAYPPITEEDKAIYYGLHIHSASNPFGLHTHVKGGKLSGAHTHSPQNRLGGHTHKDIDVKDKKYPRGYSIDGHHYHEMNENKPGGPHGHHPENFG